MPSYGSKKGLLSLSINFEIHPCWVPIKIFDPLTKKRKSAIITFNVLLKINTKRVLLSENK